MPTSLLRFTTAGATDHETGWTGPWPPPEEMILFVGKQSGIVRVMEPEQLQSPDVQAAAAYPSIDVRTYRRIEYSRLPDEAANSPHIMRGAVYERGAAT